jgi:hypothetical protein
MMYKGTNHHWTYAYLTGLTYGQVRDALHNTSDLHYIAVSTDRHTITAPHIEDWKSVSYVKLAKDNGAPIDSCLDAIRTALHNAGHTDFSLTLDKDSLSA